MAFFPPRTEPYQAIFLDKLERKLEVQKAM
jgi:hypothetical protein